MSRSLLNPLKLCENWQAKQRFLKQDEIIGKQVLMLKTAMITPNCDRRARFFLQKASERPVTKSNGTLIWMNCISQF